MQKHYTTLMLNLQNSAKALSLLLFLLCATAFAQAPSRLLATGGATTLEGQAGGGIVPWAVLAGYGSTDEFSATAFYTHTSLNDFDLDAYGVAASFGNRWELSLARHRFDLNGLTPVQSTLKQNVVGVKYRVSGDLIYHAAPQVAFGLQYKDHQNFALPDAVGADRDSDVEAYISASKLWLAGLAGRNVFANGTLRYGRSNQLGLLGFGGDLGTSRELLLEGSAGVFVNRHVALGVEYRQQPDNLSFSRQDDWFTAFIGYFPSKRLSVVAAFADLGTIATVENQTGAYLSVEYSH
ncbi:MAG: DUF3034 family protein [Lysobacterales bacterium]